MGWIVRLLLTLALRVAALCDKHSCVPPSAAHLPIIEPPGSNGLPILVGDGVGWSCSALGALAFFVVNLRSAIAVANRGRGVVKHRDHVQIGQPVDGVALACFLYAVQLTEMHHRALVLRSLPHGVLFGFDGIKPSEHSV